MESDLSYMDMAGFTNCDGKEAFLPLSPDHFIDHSLFPNTPPFGDGKEVILPLSPDHF